MMGMALLHHPAWRALFGGRHLEMSCAQFGDPDRLACQEHLT
jgi:hypothetical protein